MKIQYIINQNTEAIRGDVKIHNCWLQQKVLQHSTAMYSFFYMNWLQLAAEYDIHTWGDSNIEMPGCLCWVSENVPILNDTLSCQNIPILNGTFAEFIPNFDGNIKMEILTYRYNLFPLIPYQFGLSSHCFNSVLALLHPLYTIHLKSPTHMEWGSRFHTHIE